MPLFESPFPNMLTMQVYNEKLKEKCYMIKWEQIGNIKRILEILSRYFIFHSFLFVFEFVICKFNSQFPSLPFFPVSLIKVSSFGMDDLAFLSFLTKFFCKFNVIYNVSFTDCGSNSLKRSKEIIH